MKTQIDVLEINNTKICSKCIEEKSLDEFYSQKKFSKRKGEYIYYNPECKKCTINRFYVYRNSNLEDVKAKDRVRLKDRYHNIPEVNKKLKEHANQQRIDGKHKEWQNNNPDKTKKYSDMHRVHDITVDEWRKCLIVFENRCAYCGLESKNHIARRNNKYIIMNFHKDHVDHEGSNDLSNAIPACKSCNSSKHTSTVDEWYKMQKFFDQKKYDKIMWWLNEGFRDYITEKPPYRIFRKQNNDKNTFHWELWSVDEQRNLVECLIVASKRAEIINDLGLNEYQ